jgi:hypothetical protein
MRSKNIYMVASVAITCLMGGFITPTVAQADDTSPPVIETAVAGYMEEIETSYTKPESRQEETDQQVLAKKEAQITLNSTNKYGLKIEDVNVEYEIIKSEDYASDQSTVTVDVTTSMNQVAEAGTEITIAKEHRDHLESSGTDRHILTLAPDKTKTGYTVIKDEIAEPVNTEANSSGLENLPKTGTPLTKKLKADDPFVNSAGVNYVDLINYAERWTDSDYASIMNPNFPIYTNESNCTNFASQALYAGGLPLKDSINVFNPSDPTLWTYHLAGIAEATHTWSGADNNWAYMRDHSNSYDDNGASPWTGWEGSLIYGDWEQDGTWDHVMIVVGVVVSNGVRTPVICQKDKNRHEYLFSSSEASAKEEYGTVSWSLLQYRYE